MLNIDLIRRVNLISHWESVKKKMSGASVTLFLFFSLLFYWGCSLRESLHLCCTCGSLVFCLQQCGPTKCLTFPYRSYKPKVAMEIHWVAVAGKLECWKE